MAREDLASGPGVLTTARQIGSALGLPIALAFIIQFAIGGVTGVQFASVPIDWQTHDSY